MMKKLLKWILGILTVLLIAALLIFKPVPDQTLETSTFYQSTLNKIAIDGKQKKAFSTGDIKIGWNKQTLLDGNVHPLAGYGARLGKPFSAINDSIWVNAIYIGNTDVQIAYISFDLLIAPPVVCNLISDALEKTGFDRESIYFTATHSHSSAGGWQEGLMGKLMSGEYDETYVQYIVDQSIAAVIKAKHTSSIGAIGASEVKVDTLVDNRLIREVESKDPWFKLIKLKNKENQTALLSAYAAHATCFQMNFDKLSGDYPGALVRYIEKDSSIDFAVFGAGAMASMAFSAPYGTDHERNQYISEALGTIAINESRTITLETTDTISYFKTQIELPVPSPKLNQWLALRAWVFRALVGQPRPEVSSLKIGKILFVGLPCDFSGELSSALYTKARKKGLFLVINSFNGDYIGYVTRDKWYYRKKPETQIMSWYGPKMGQYFSDIVSTVIDAY